MSATGLTVFDRTLQKTNQFINDVGAKIGIEDKHVVFIGIRAVFKSLRDRLPVEEAALTVRCLRKDCLTNSTSYCGTIKFDIFKLV